MMRYYDIGGIRFSLNGPPFKESSYLAPFRCEPCLTEVEFTVELGHPAVPTELSPVKATLHTKEFSLLGRKIQAVFQEHSDRLLLTKEEISPKKYQICLEETCADLYDNNLVLKIIDLPQLFLSYGALFLHASLVIHKGRAILFSAPKQTGKSTQATLWEIHRNAQIVNGDRALLRFMDGTWMAYGSPYCGTSGICQNAACPIGALVLLQQGKVNEIRKASPSKIVAAFLDGCTFDPEMQTETVLDIALSLSQTVPVLHFSCLPDASAVDFLDSALATLPFS